VSKYVSNFQTFPTNNFCVCANVLHFPKPQGKYVENLIFKVGQFFFIKKMLLIFQMNIYKHKLISRIGLMHTIATNLCVWLSVLIMETSYEIAHHTEREQMMEETFDHFKAEPFTDGVS